MTHVMVPDGVLAPWLWIGGWMATLAGLGLALWATRESDRTRLVPLAAVLAAVMTLVMSLEIVPLAYEPHLTVLSGILLGPAYAFLATFVFNALRMLFGDGGITLLGLNTLLLGLEAVLGYYAFRALAGALPSARPRGAGAAAGVATVIALAAATVAFLAVVALGNVELTQLAEENVLERIGTEAPGFGAFAGTVLALGAVGWVLEAVVVGATVAFLRAVRPALVPLREPAPAGLATPAPARTSSAEPAASPPGARGSR